MKIDYTEIVHREAIIEPADVAETDGGGWIITARAVPYGQPTEILPGYTEEIAPGALHPTSTGALLFRDHQYPIGKIIAYVDREDGLEITAVISNTPLGAETRQLIADGVLTRMSIAFRPARDGYEVTETDDDVHVVIRDAELYEVSVVAFPAYEDTPILDQRTKTTKTTQTTTGRKKMENDVVNRLEDAITLTRTDLAGLEARMAELDTRATPAEHPLAIYESLGDYAKRAPAGINFREAVKSTNAVTPPVWLGRIQARMAAKQRVTNAFTHKMDLPGQGTTISYAIYSEDDLKAEAYKEGTRVQTGGMRDVEKTAQIEAFAGGTQITRKTINRADPAFITNLLERQAIKYAKKIESWNVQLVRGTVVEIATSRSVGGLTTAAAITADSLRDIIIDAQKYYDESDQYVCDGLLLSWDLIKTIAKIGEEKRLLRWTGSDQAAGNDGVIDPSAPISLSLYGVPVVPIPGETIAGFFDRRSVVCQESPGAPITLQQDQVLDLQRDIAVYGEAAHYVQFPGGILPLVFKQG